MKFFKKWVILPFMTIIVITSVFVALVAYFLQVILIGVVMGAMFILQEACSYAK